MKVGFFGKLPSFGDFIQRNVTVRLVDEWDNWLSQGLNSSQHQLQRQWQYYYFTSPIWRFCFKPRFNSQSIVVGLMMPSVDKTGRAYPFTLLCELQSQADVFSVTTAIDPLHQQAELVLLALLDSPSPDLDDCVVNLQHLYRSFALKPKTDVNKSQRSTTELFRAENSTLDTDSCSSLHEMHYQFMSNYLKQHQTTVSIWHYGATKMLKRHIRYYHTMPPVEAYSSLLLADND